MLSSNQIENTATRLADLTSNLLTGCYEKEERLAKQQGLTQAEFRCLRHLHQNEKINNKEIADRMNLSASRLTRIVDGLVNKGYVVREIEANDRRNMSLYLSVKGVEFVKQLNEAYIEIHEQILQNITIDQHQPLINAISQLLQAVQKWIAK